ncbi:MAG: hypothetical protein EB084_07380 [Proteobacteria bacterium]|nr:hypothetical protein [Pseudomonadota bacterium]
MRCRLVDEALERSPSLRGGSRERVGGSAPAASSAGRRRRKRETTSGGRYISRSKITQLTHHIEKRIECLDLDARRIHVDTRRLWSSRRVGHGSGGSSLRGEVAESASTLSKADPRRVQFYRKVTLRSRPGCLGINRIDLLVSVADAMRRSSQPPSSRGHEPRLV